MSKKIFMGVIVFLIGIKVFGDGYLKGYLKGLIEEFEDAIFQIIVKYKKHI